MAAMPLKTPVWGSCLLALGLACATFLPAWSGQSLAQSTGTKPTWTTNPADVPVVDQGSTAASPQPLSVPTWSPVPPPPEASPGWVWLQNGPGPAPAWAPPTPPLINTAPLWQGG
jgi:hypothetical protein